MGSRFSKKKKGSKYPDSALSLEVTESDVKDYMPEPIPKFEKGFKIITVGQGGVGKSCLVIRFVTGKFYDQYDPTIEDSYRKTISIYNNGPTITLDILDTAGKDEFSSMRDHWMRESNLTLLCCSCIGNTLACDEIESRREMIQRTKNIIDPIIIVCITKCDLFNDKYCKYIQNQRESVIQLCEKYKYAYIETSAKNGINVQYLFETCFLEYLYQVKVPVDKRNKITKVLISDKKSDH